MRDRCEKVKERGNLNWKPVERVGGIIDHAFISYAHAPI